MEGSTKLLIKLKANNGQFDYISLVIKTICILQTKRVQNYCIFCHRLRIEYIEGSPLEVRRYYGRLNRVLGSIVPELILRRLMPGPQGKCWETDKRKEIPSTPAGSTEGTGLGNFPT